MKILLAGGGTAGHIEPALAVARGWIARHPEDEVLFLGTVEGLENALIPAAGYPLHNIPKVAIARELSPSLLKVPFQLIASIAGTMRALKGVDCAIGFGGYVSAPLYIAAAITRTPFLIHEQNAQPGWANRIGAYFTKFRAISYPVSSGRLAKAELTGLPLRGDVLDAIATASLDWEAARNSAKEKIEQRYGLSSRKPLIFIFGGSQGSQAINSVIEAAQESLVDQGVAILHGVGKKNLLANPTDSYQPMNYIDEMAQCYLAADLLIARSGAVTCAEASALSRYSLFIPLPVGNGEQAQNAKALIESGRAQLLEQKDFNAGWLTANLASLLAKSSQLSPVGNDSGADAVDKILELIERAAGVR